jgi:PHD/YefM family antitoxin component YafN of YafNO toxin-antitoxin module
MKASEDIRPISYMKSCAADLLNQVNTTHRAVVITQSGHARAILQDPETYEQTRAAIGMLKLIVQGEQDVQAGRLRNQAEVFTRLEKKLTTRPAAR